MKGTTVPPRTWLRNTACPCRWVRRKGLVVAFEAAFSTRSNQARVRPTHRSVAPGERPTLGQEPSMLPSNLPSLLVQHSPVQGLNLIPIRSRLHLLASRSPSSSPTSTNELRNSGQVLTRQNVDVLTVGLSCVKRHAKQRCTAGISLEIWCAYWNGLLEAFERRQCAMPTTKTGTTYDAEREKRRSACAG